VLVRIQFGNCLIRANLVQQLAELLFLQLSDGVFDGVKKDRVEAMCCWCMRMCNGGSCLSRVH
jgi:hypothetical protein